MTVDGLHLALLGRHPSGHARVHLLLRDNTEALFDVGGEAVRIDKDLAPNSEGRTITYAGVDCTIIHKSVKSIQACSGTTGTRSCEVGVELGGRPHAYLVTLSIAPVGAIATRLAQ
jgi:hypothetical protein